MNLVSYAKMVGVSILALALPLNGVYAQTASQLQKFQQLSRSDQESIARAAGIKLPAGDQYQRKREDVSPTIERRDEFALANAGSKQGDAIKENADGNVLIDPDTGLHYFGYDVFAGHPTSFTPIADLPVPADYVVGPGDVITVQMFGKENDNFRLEVGRGGYINFPKLGPISVSGQSFSQVKDGLSDQIKRKMIGVEAAIGIDGVRLMQVYVLGEAFRPGAYNIPSLATVTQAIIAAGGINATGSLRRIKVYRNSKAVVDLDLYRFLTVGKSVDDVRLQSGDVVFIEPVRSRVAIGGHVVRSAVYEILPGETIGDLLKYAGGETDKANLEAIRIERKINAGVTVSTVNGSNKGINGKSYRLVGGDKVSVPSKNDGLVSGVKLAGAFVNPGYREFVPGMRVSDLFGDIESELQNFADRRLAILFRESSSSVVVNYVELDEVLKRPKSKGDVILERRDEFIVLPDSYRNFAVRTSDEPGDRATTKLDATKLEQFSSVARQRRELVEALIQRIRASASANHMSPIVEVRGAVRYPGVYPLGEGQDLEQLITIAGGMKESAFAEQVELARVRIEDSGEIVVENKKIDIGSKGLSGLPLVARDRVTVFENPDWRNDITVSLEGEVRFPGSYSFSRGETLSQLIERAGGFTGFAYPRGAILSRDGLRKREARELARLRVNLKEDLASLGGRGASSRGGGGVSLPEAMSAVDALGEVEALGRLVVDVTAALAGSEIHDIPLEDGDRLIIPVSGKTVTVIGEVQYASSHVFEKGLRYQDYLSRAGGLKDRADKERIYIIRANGSVILPKNSWFGVEIQEGDTIVVPIDSQHVDRLTLFSTVTQILFQLGVAYDVIKD